jgi:TolB-like protein/Tfp pilus assembly protein PilF
MATVVRFDCFEIDLSSGQVRKNGIRIPLREQSFQVLASLLEQPGRVVTRDDLRRRLWPEGIVVDFDNNLNTAVARLREALGDSAERPRFVETIPRRGYRFLATVSQDAPAPDLPQPPAIARVLVLPFVNLTGDPGQEYFSDAMTDEVITELSARAPELGVIARTTAMRYKRTHKDIARIGRELNVQYVVEGGVCPQGARVAITAQLVRVSDQTHLFARRYDADVRELFDLRTRIAAAIARCIPTPAEAAPMAHHDLPPGRKPTDDLEAYKEYIQGRYLFDRANPDSIKRAKQRFENAIARDPGFALAHDGLAEVYTYLGYFGFMRPRDAYSIGISHALAAVEIDDTLAEAHAVLAEYHKQLDFNWPAAERQMARALELNRSSPIVRLRHAVAVLMPHNRIGEAIAEVERALESDPLSVVAQTWLGALCLLGRQPDRAIDAAERLLEFEPDSCWGFFIRGGAYRHKYVEAAAAGDCRAEWAEEAIRGHTSAVELSSGLEIFFGWLGLALGLCGRQVEARVVLQQLQQSARYNLPTSFGFVHLALGEIDAAFEWFDRAVEERDQIMMPILSYAHFDPIRDDPRFAALLRKMKLA